MSDGVVDIVLGEVGGVPGHGAVIGVVVKDLTRKGLEHGTQKGDRG
jgi:hypothetical protein